MILIKQKSDILGTFASSLCLIHCIATPFLFIAQAGSSTCCDTTPEWWKFMDYFFLAISFIAIYWTAKTTIINGVTPMLWLSWFVLATVILNEKLEMYPLPEAVVYVPAIALMTLHLYNRKYCKCKTDKCCVNEG